VLVALSTAFMTSPMVYFWYERKRKPGELTSGSYNMLIHGNEALPSHIGAVAALLFPRTQQITVTALSVKEIRERSSAYITAEIKRLREKALKPGKAKKRIAMFGDLKAMLEEKGALFKTKVLHAPNPPEDVQAFIDFRGFNMILFELKQKIEPADASLPEQIETLFNWDSTLAKTVENAINGVVSPVSVLIDKMAPSRNSIEHILFLWSAQTYEFSAFTLMKQLIDEAKIRITIATTVDSFAETVDKERVTIIQTKPGNYEFLENITDPIDLVVIGGDRANNDFYGSPLIQTFPAPVLFIYPPKKKIQFVELPV